MNQSKTFQIIIITLLLIIIVLLSVLLSHKNKIPPFFVGENIQTSVTQDNITLYDKPYYNSLDGLEDEQIFDLMKDWKSVNFSGGGGAPYPPDWTYSTSEGRQRIYPPWNTNQDDSDYIEFNIKNPSQELLQSRSCIGDNEVVSCRFGNNEKTKKVFDLMFLFH